MITLMIREKAVSRGITTAYQLQKALDVVPSVGARLWRDDLTKIDLNILDKLCTVLKCRPGDLLVYAPENGAKKEK